jgi:hypothetical protein
VNHRAPTIGMANTPATVGVVIAASAARNTSSDVDAAVLMALVPTCGMRCVASLQLVSYVRGNRKT